MCLPLVNRVDLNVHTTEQRILRSRAGTKRAVLPSPPSPITPYRSEYYLPPQLSFGHGAKCGPESCAICASAVRRRLDSAAKNRSVTVTERRWDSPVAADKQSLVHRGMRSDFNRPVSINFTNEVLSLGFRSRRLGSWVDIRTKRRSARRCSSPQAHASRR